MSPFYVNSKFAVYIFFQYPDAHVTSKLPPLVNIIKFCIPPVSINIKPLRRATNNMLTFHIASCNGANRTGCTLILFILDKNVALNSLS